jgi:hypothetical protein
VSGLEGQGIRLTQPFDFFAQGRESFDFAQDRELVERPVEWQMGVFPQPHRLKWQGQRVADGPSLNDKGYGG